MQGYDQAIPNLLPEEAKGELPGWERSYITIERYHDRLQRQLEKGNIKGQNAMTFLAIVAATKATIASIITSLAMASRVRKASTSSDPDIITALIEMGKRNLLQLVTK